jgi:hypothetical protein
MGHEFNELHQISIWVKNVSVGEERKYNDDEARPFLVDLKSSKVVDLTAVEGKEGMRA